MEGIEPATCQSLCVRANLRAHLRSLHLFVLPLQVRNPTAVKMPENLNGKYLSIEYGRSKLNDRLARMNRLPPKEIKVFSRLFRRFVCLAFSIKLVGLRSLFGLRMNPGRSHGLVAHGVKGHLVYFITARG